MVRTNGCHPSLGRSKVLPKRSTWGLGRSKVQGEVKSMGRSTEKIELGNST